MRTRILHPLATALLAALLVLPGSASAGAGSVTQCRNPSVPITACATLSWTSSVTSCSYVAPGDWGCTVAYTLTLALAGASCAWAWSAPTGEMLLCSIGASTLTSPPASAAYDGIPAGGATENEDATVCIDYGTHLERCTQTTMSTLVPGPP